MCGIAGQVHWDRGTSREIVSAMSECLRHRGPDDEGSWSSTDGICLMAHRRLAVIDLSERGHQPMVDASTGNAIVFNGEIYNYQELRADCERDGEIFVSDTDTEVILALYRRQGVSCVTRLRGMFAFAIWDNTTRELVLARDRVGKKPLHYARTPQGLLFASELAALARQPLVDTSIDGAALELYLQLQSVPNPLTIYSGIRKLEPGHYARVRPHGIEITPYWDVDYRPRRRVSDDEAVDLFEEKLTEAVRLRMIADVPVGALLSGGVDSSLVVALMAKLDIAPVRTFSVGFDDEQFSELAWAAMAARICGTEHHAEIVRGDVASLLPTIARHYGEPFADSSAIPSFHVSRTARKHVTVVLNGDGGDELLGGYPRYTLPAFTPFRRMSRLLGNDRLLALAAAGAGSQRPTDKLTRMLVHLINPDLTGLLIYTPNWNDDERARLLGGSPTTTLSQWRHEWLSAASNHASNRIDRLLYMDNRTYLPDDLLVKIDIASMHRGLEARSPLLDHELIEFAAELPTSMKVRHRTGKFLIKKLAERYYPRELVHRRKMGFAIPLARWLRTELRAETEQIILSRSVMDPLDPHEIETVWRRFLAGTNGDRDAHRIWILLMYGHWKLALQPAA